MAPYSTNYNKRPTHAASPPRQAEAVRERIRGKKQTRKHQKLNEAKTDIVVPYSTNYNKRPTHAASPPRLAEAIRERIRGMKLFKYWLALESFAESSILKI